MTQEYVDTNVLNHILNEINELKEFKRLYESQKKDKQTMSDRLYELMILKYNATPFIDRKAYYTEDRCSCCRFEDWCDKNITIPKNVGMPIPSEESWIPGTTGCGKFDWD